MDAKLVFKALKMSAFAFALYKTLSALRRLSNPKHSVAKKDRLAPTPKQFFNRYFQSEKTGLWLYRKIWRPASDVPVRGAVFLLHGFGEYCGRYDHVADALNKIGLVVLAMDHQGHGHSEGDRAHVEAWSDFVDDAVQFITTENKALDPDMPRFLLGHSMGGAMAIHVASRIPEILSGVVLSGPAIRVDPKVASPFMRFLAGIFSSVLPKICLDSLDPTTVSRELAVVQNYSHDPLTQVPGMRARLGNEMLKAMEWVQREAKNHSLPTLLVHGAADPLCPVDGSRQFFKDIASPDKTIIVYPDLYHEIFLETEWETVLSDVTKWLLKKLE